MHRRRGLLPTLLPPLLWAPQAGGDGPSVRQFELKELESRRGYLQFQSQNAFSWGQPQRRVVELAPGEGEFLYDENTVIRQRHALEVETGFSRRFKTRFGIEFEKERIDEPATPADADSFSALKLAEIGGEAIFVLLPREADGFGIGFVAEIERPLEDAEAMSLLLGPIIEWQRGAWSANLMPTVVRAFGGDPEPDEEVDDKWDFAYAVRLRYELSPIWALGLEAYGTVDRVGDTGRRSRSSEIFGDFDQHRVGPLIYATIPLSSVVPVRAGSTDPNHGEEAATMSLGLGFLAGLTEHTPDGTLKVSLEVDF